ncbi:MAG: efflux RND transporter permease subunit [Bacteroidetes bacterium]|nr:MAG: efflux RND transporter permease subunit [Bacteroidota bacterium]
MRKIIEFLVKYPIWANSLLLAMICFGSIAYGLKLKKSFFPELQPRNISITVVMPGASPEEMEEGVTIKIEESLKGISGIDEVTSTSSENLSVINLKTLKDYDLDEVATEVKNAVDRINSFPVQAERPTIFKAKPQSTCLFIGVKSKNPNVDRYELKKYVDKIEDDLLAGEVSQVVVRGLAGLEISIEVKEENLSRFGITFDQVAAAVRLNNRDISAGSIKARSEEILIRSRAKTTDADKIGNIVLRANTDGKNILLKDIANISEKFTDTPSDFYINGKQALLIQVDKVIEEDLEVVTKFCEKYIEKFNAENSDVELVVTFNFLDLLDERLSMLQSNGVSGLVLVLICLGFFLSLRLSFWVAMGIPISFFGMFAIIAGMGLTINMISLFGMILVVGILVDDGIVISENVYTHFERGKSPIQAAIDGTLEVMPAVATSVTTTIVAFLPLLVLENFEFLVEMAIVVIVCLIVSLAEAFFTLPAHLASAGVLERKKKDDNSFGTKLRAKFDNFIDKIRFGAYAKWLDIALRYRYIFITIPFAFIFLVQGLLSGGFIQSVFFPNIPPDRFEVDLAFTAGTREDKVREFLKKFESNVWELNDELKKEYSDSNDFIAYALTSIGRTSDGTETGGHAGYISVLLKNMDTRKISTFDIMAKLRTKIGKVEEAQKFKVGGVNRFGKPISVSLLGKNGQELDLAKADMKKALQNFSSLKDVVDNQTLGKREIQIELKPKAYFLGLTHDVITRQIRQGFFGEEIQRLQKGTDEVRVWVRYPEEDRFSVGQLENMKIKAANGAEYPLSEVANYKVERSIVNIKHYNGFKEIVIEAELENPNTSTLPIIEELEKKIIPQIKAKYKSVDVSFGGQQRQTAKSLGSLKEVLFPVLFVMVMLLALTFRSFSQAFLVFMMIPIGIHCAILGHGIESWIGSSVKPVSIFSFWGMLALAGVIINDSVVLVEKFNQNIKEGMTMMEAVHDAGISRFRAIILTSLTTVVGLYPLILERSFQAQFLIPMAISMAYGLAIGTFFNLFIFPVMIMVANDSRRGTRWVIRLISSLWTGNYATLTLPSREEVEPSMREHTRLEKNELEK